VTAASEAEKAGARIMRMFGASSPQIAALMGRSRTWVQYWTSPRVRQTLQEWSRKGSPRRMDALRRHFDGRADLDQRRGNMIERPALSPEESRFRRKLQRIAREETAARNSGRPSLQMTPADGARG
jgi:hypothetical protein